MTITPQERRIVFRFQRSSPTRRTITANSSPWLVLGPLDGDRSIDADADWGPGSSGSDYIASELINRIFEPYVPGYGRIRGWPAMNGDYTSAVASMFLASETRSDFEITSDDIIALAPSDYTVGPPLERPQWPSPGEKIRFREVGLAFSRKYIEDARRLLVPGTVYTISAIECASSSTKVSLVETGEAEFNFQWFDRL